MSCSKCKQWGLEISSEMISKYMQKWYLEVNQNDKAAGEYEWWLESLTEHRLYIPDGDSSDPNQLLCKCDLNLEKTRQIINTVCYENNINNLQNMERDLARYRDAIANCKHGYKKLEMNPAHVNWWNECLENGECKCELDSTIVHNILKEIFKRRQPTEKKNQLNLRHFERDVDHYRTALVGPCEHTVANRVRPSTNCEMTFTEDEVIDIMFGQYIEKGKCKCNIEWGYVRFVINKLAKRNGIEIKHMNRDIERYRTLLVGPCKHYTTYGYVCSSCTAAQSCEKCGIPITGNSVIGEIFGKKYPPPPPPTK